jgi:hypothetical protein
MARSFAFAALALFPFAVLAPVTFAAVPWVIGGLVLAVVLLRLARRWRALPAASIGWALPGAPAVMVMRRGNVWAVVFGELQQVARLYEVREAKHGNG